MTCGERHRNSFSFLNPRLSRARNRDQVLIRSRVADQLPLSYGFVLVYSFAKVGLWHPPFARGFPTFGGRKLRPLLAVSTTTKIGRRQDFTECLEY